MSRVHHVPAIQMGHTDKHASLFMAPSVSLLGGGKKMRWWKCYLKPE